MAGTALPLTLDQGYGNPSAAINYGGNPNIGGSGGSYGVLPGQAYASGANMGGLVNNIPGTYQTQYGNVSINSAGQSPQSLPGPTNTATPNNPNTVSGPPSGGSSAPVNQFGQVIGPGVTGYVNPNTIPGTPEFYANNLNINTSAYDQAVKDLQGYVPILQNQAQNSQGAINQSVSDITNQANTGEQQAQNTADSATKQQALALQTALGGNNAYAASFGSGLSSFGQGLNNQTYQNYGNTMGGIQNNLQSSLQQFENQKNSAAAWGQNQIAGIQNSLQQGLQQVALNVDQTDMQKANMVAQIQMQAQQQVNQINSIVAQLQANIASAQQNTLASAALYSNTNPQLASNISNLANAFASNANRNVSSVFPGMPGMYGSNTLQNLYGSNVPNQNPYINFNYGSTNGQ